MKNKLFWISCFFSVITALYCSIFFMRRIPLPIYPIFLAVNIVCLIVNIVCFIIEIKKNKHQQ